MLSAADPVVLRCSPMFFLSFLRLTTRRRGCDVYRWWMVVAWTSLVTPSSKMRPPATRPEEPLAARGSNENINGLLRQYLPRHVSMRDYSQADLDDIAAELNGRPRQTLGFKTPSEALNEALR